MATTFHFFLKKRQKKNGEYPIYLRVTHNRKHSYKTTGVSVKKKFWNARQEVVRGSHPKEATLNKILDQVLKEAEEQYSQNSRHGEKSAKSVIEKIKEKETADFFDYAKDYLDEKKKDQKHSQVVQGTVAFNKVEQFEGKRTLPFNKITPHYLNELQKYLQRPPHNNKASTVRKTFQPIKKVIHRAVMNKIIDYDPFVGFNLVKDTKPPKKTKLSIEQIRAIEGLDLEPGSSIWHSRNAFLFSFYGAGIRFGDVCCLKWDNIKDGRLTYRMNKNDKQFSSELNAYQKEILERYKPKPGTYIFPFLNSSKKYTPITLRKRIASKNVTVSRHLKAMKNMVNKKIEKEEIECKKIEGKVSFHIARHSFAQYAIEKGLDIYKLMQTLRHAKIETTQKYLKSLDDELADKAMREVF